MENQVQVQNLRIFAIREDEFKKRVKQFVDDFNIINTNPDAELDLRTTVLDGNVVVVGVDHQDTYLGIDDVIAFLKKSAGHFEMVAPFYQVLADNGYAIGVGNWEDKDDPIGPILFSFVFVNRNPSDPKDPDWKAIRLWGSRPLGDLS
jgi:hypothetical protein